MGTDLAQRVAGQAQRTATADSKPATVYQLLERSKPEFARVLPKHLDPDRMTRLALTQLRTVRGLAACTPESFLGAIMTCSQLGLEPGVSGEAYLIPYGRECTLVIGYKGMAKLFWQSPLAKSLDAQAVYEHDEFDYEYGLTPALKHKPKLAADRGKPIAYYAVATMSNGGAAFVVLSPSDIDAIRKRSKAKDNGPWSTDYDAMAKKTCVRQLFKLLPASVELTRAVAHDETVRTSIDPGELDSTPPYIDGETVDATTGEVGGELVHGEGFPPGAHQDDASGGDQ